MGHAHVILINQQIIQLGTTAGDYANWVAWQIQINDRLNRCSPREKVNWPMLIAQIYVVNILRKGQNRHHFVDIHTALLHWANIVIRALWIRKYIHEKQ